MSETVEALIVGAGPSGLAGLRRLREAGLSVLALEKRWDVGGVWLYEEDPTGHSSAYRTLVTITSKRCSEMEGFPFPDEWPDYLPYALVQTYFRRYAEHFGLLEHIRFGEEVIQASRTDDHWQVTTAAGKRYEARYLIVASGHHWKPFLPTYPGTFSGESYHAHAYKDPIQLKDKRVLIVGAGNSGADIATDAVRVAKSVAISIRRGYHILPKFGFFGEPTDVLYKKLVAPLPRFLHRPMTTLTLRLLRGSMTRYGLPEPKEPLFYTHPLVNSELLYHLRHGKVQIKPGIAQLEGQKVHFTDGSIEEFDTLVWATGYEVAFPYLPADLVPVGENARHLYLNLFFLKEPTLLFLGLIQPNGCLWNLSEKQAALIARYIQGAYKLPADVEAQASAYWEAHRRRYADSPRHVWEVDWYDYARQIDRLVRRHPLRALSHA
ncbi:MAG: NAD(P)-binding domain-containing protein [Bacteroidia bacterium]|jgi:cation diffusion facilitator CzcD-associated flavoprotein CzcO|nr:NAD(P)-binding domain-containing protein [Bacteroidia bacterium]GIV22586.1 MAG: monooxygenase [Bacteroidia bacterium]